jgi:hypothetical protein
MKKTLQSKLKQKSLDLENAKVKINTLEKKLLRLEQESKFDINIDNDVNESIDESGSESDFEPLFDKLSLIDLKTKEFSENKSLMKRLTELERTYKSLMIIMDQAEDEELDDLLHSSKQFYKSKEHATHFSKLLNRYIDQLPSSERPSVVSIQLALKWVGEHGSEFKNSDRFYVERSRGLNVSKYFNNFLGSLESSLGMIKKRQSYKKIVRNVEELLFNPELFTPELISNPKYLNNRIMQSRIYGLLSLAGVSLGYISEFGRKFQGESNGLFLTKIGSYDPKILFDFESANSSVSKIKEKLESFDLIRNKIPSLDLIGFFMPTNYTIHNWKKTNNQKETIDYRKKFAKLILPGLIHKIYTNSINNNLGFFTGIFYNDNFELSLYFNNQKIEERVISYNK